MKAVLITLTVLLTAQLLFAQNDNATLQVQSPDGKKVMLVWFLKKWDNNITGFDIKRKEGLKDWVKLNSDPIIPGISMKKKLSIVDADKAEVNTLEARLYKLLATHKLKETENAAYLQKLTTDDKALYELCDQMAHDYDFALMNGFAYKDLTEKKKTNYQYGLFIQGTDRLLAKADWNYGEIPDLNTIHEITSRATTKTKGVQLSWDADIEKMKQADVLGFNIYREGLRLNDDPVKLTDSKDPSVFIWNDKSANSNQPIQYSISAETIFGIEGIVKPYLYNPADHPAEYKQAQVTEVTSSGYYLKDGINVKWTFPKEEEHFLKGFYVEKDNMPAGYSRVSQLLESSARSFTDKSSSPLNSYIRFRVIAVYTDRSNVRGTERLYSYFPVAEPPVPQELKAKPEPAVVQIEKKNTILLSWALPINGDAITDGYRIYVLKPGNANFLLVNTGHLVKGNSYTYNIPDGSPGLYKFYITAVGKSSTESNPGNTVTVDIQPGNQ